MKRSYSSISSGRLFVKAITAVFLLLLAGTTNAAVVRYDGLGTTVLGFDGITFGGKNYSVDVGAYDFDDVTVGYEIFSITDTKLIADQILAAITSDSNLNDSPDLTNGGTSTAQCGTSFVSSNIPDVVTQLYGAGYVEVRNYNDRTDFSRIDTSGAVFDGLSG